MTEAYGDDDKEVTGLREQFDAENIEAAKLRQETEPLVKQARDQHRQQFEQTLRGVEKFFTARTAEGYGDVCDAEALKASIRDNRPHPLLALAIRVENALLSTGQKCTQDEALAAAFELMTRNHPSRKAAALREEKAKQRGAGVGVAPTARGSATGAKGDPWAKVRANLGKLDVPD